MNEKVKKFLELVSAEGQESIERMNKADKDELIAMAAQKGITLTEEDFKPQSGELSDDEMEAVAGGYSQCGEGRCACFNSGEGNGKKYEIRLCVFHGVSDERCQCNSYGMGDPE